MASVAAPTQRQPTLAGRLSAALAAAWGALTGVAPHVLHHVGPLAGAVVLVGAGGKVLFAAIGLIVSAPLLRRLHRRFCTLAAPAVALVLFAATFAFSSFVIGPAISGSSENGEPATPSIDRPDHADHHDR